MTASLPVQLTGLVSRTRPVSGGADLLDALGPGGFAWIAGGSGFVTAGVAARVPVAPGSGRFGRAAGDVADLLGAIAADDPLRLPGTGPVAVGALPFDDRRAGELVVPAVVVGRDPSGQWWVTETGAGPSPIGMPLAPEGPVARNGRHPGGAGPGLAARERPGREEWTAAVRRILGAIDAGRLRKVVLAREVVLEAGRPFDRRAVLDRLRRVHPTSFTYAAGSFVGASPELLVRRRGSDVQSCPMAGTIRRGATPADDERLVDGLCRSVKDAEEHSLLVEAVLEALAPACAGRPAAEPPEVVRLATVSHLATRVSGRLADPAPSVLSLVGLLHPTPAVGGLPRRAALAAIAGLERFDRGLYAGPVGWVDAGGGGEWAVALRGAELDGPRARLLAGAGIVAGSDPEAEWDETEAKLASMLAALRD